MSAHVEFLHCPSAWCAISMKTRFFITFALINSFSSIVLADGGSGGAREVLYTAACPAGQTGSIVYKCTQDVRNQGETCERSGQSTYGQGRYAKYWSLKSNTCRVSNIPPISDNKILILDEDTIGSVALSATDPDSPQPTIFQLLGTSTNGTSTIRGDVLTFTPKPDWNGVTTVTYRAQDTAGAWSEPATVTITVNPINDAPIAQNKTLVIDEDTTGNVTLSATDVDSPTPTIFEVVNGSAYGTTSLSGSVLSFSPNQDWSGITTITYRAQDTAGAWSQPAAVTITVNPVNDPPLIVDRVLNIDEDVPGSMTLSATDVENNIPFTFKLLSVTPSKAGQTSITGSTLTFNPTLNWNGQVKILYQATDNDGGVSLPAAITVNVAPVNDAPTLTDATIRIMTRESTPTTVRTKVSH